MPRAVRLGPDLARSPMEDMVNTRHHLDRSLPIFFCLVLLTLTGCPPEEETPTENNAMENNSTTPSNTKPVADAGSNQVAYVGDTVEVSAAQSTDADGDVLTVAWSIFPPEGSEVELMNADQFRASFVPDVPGDYQLDLVVNDGTEDSDLARVYVRVAERTTPVNEAPVADAGVDATYFLDQTLTLDGTGSSDPNGDELTYKWTITSQPDGASASLEDPTAASTALVTDTPGTYEVELVVNDGELASAPDSVTLTIQDVTPTNTPPVADAGMDQMIDLGMAVTLDGTGSYDDDGDALTYQWTISTQPPESAATLTGETTSAPSFTPDVGGRYEIQLVVDDGTEFSAPDTVAIEVTSEMTSPPVAVAPPAAIIPLGQPYTLDGTGSYDDDGDSLTYSWLLLSSPAGSTVLLQGASTATPKLTPDQEGDYVVRLTVNDGTFNSMPVQTTLTAALIQPPCVRFSEYIEGTSNNKAFEIENCGMSDLDLTDIKVCLVANADQDCGSTETLSGTLAAGDVLAFCQTQLSSSVADLSKCDYTSTTTNFNGDDRLVVFQDPDGDGQPNTSTDVLDAFGETTIQPSSKPWEDISLRRCDNARYDGQTMFDISTYRDTGVVDDFSNLGEPTPAGFCSGMTVNTAPVAVAGSNRNVITGNPAQLDGSNSTDAEGDPLTYSWTLTSAPMNSTAMLIDPMTATPSITPDLDGAYVIELVVNDGMLDSAPASITLNAGMTTTQPGDCLKISEYIEGTSNNKALELYNCGMTDLDLTDIKVCLVSNGNTACGATLDLTGMLLSSEVTGICQPQIDMSKVDATDCDYSSTVVNFNGNDRLIIFNDPDGNDIPDTPGDVLDAFGKTDTEPSSSEWADMTLRRCDFATYYDGTTAFDYTLYYEKAMTVDDFSTFGDLPAMCMMAP